RGRVTPTWRPPSTTGPVAVPCQLAFRSGILACLGPTRAVISTSSISAITIRPTSAQKPSSPSFTAPARSANATVASSGKPARLAVSTSVTLTTGTFFFTVVLLLLGCLAGRPTPCQMQGLRRGTTALLQQPGGQPPFRPIGDTCESELIQPNPR